VEKYKFKCEDRGNCRVYYTKTRKLFCIQDKTSWGNRRLSFCVCSRDGEPSHEIAMPKKEEFDHYVEP
jgi:hypothetical protein